MPNPIVHFEICVKNGAKGVTFYSQLFDWKITHDEKMNYNMVETGEGALAGGIFQAEEGKFPPYLTFYVSVDDLQKYLDKAVKLGGKVIVPPSPIPGFGSFAMFHDPDGNLVGLFKAAM